MAIINWRNEGQDEFDFDYLLKNTDEHFVKKINSVINFSEKRDLKQINLEIEPSGHVIVTIIDGSAVTILEYSQALRECLGEFILNKYELLDILEVMNGG